MIHQFFYNSLHISHYKHVAIKKKKGYVSSWICWLSTFYWIPFWESFEIIIFSHRGFTYWYFWQLGKIYFQNTVVFYRLTNFHTALWQKVLDLWKISFQQSSQKDENQPQEGAF